MTAYLTFMTTLLVLTQIIRLWQNSRQLQKYDEHKREYALQIRVFEKLEEVLDKKMEEEA